MIEVGNMEKTNADESTIIKLGKDVVAEKYGNLLKCMKR